ncbi:MAG: DUF5721 family protein [Eubacteriales bacterium]|nr:DUF5721 family protein [Eubacteriales bacterium]
MLQLTLPQTKQTMQALLLSSLFDDFFFVRGSVTTAFRQELDGHLLAEFYGADERPAAAFVRWQEVRPLYTAQIKGQRLPLEINLTLCPSEAMLSRFHSTNEPYLDLDLRLHFHYRGGLLTCTSAASWQQFNPDTDPLKAWDSFVCDWLVEIELPFSFTV